MDISCFVLYLITRLDGIKTFLVAASAIIFAVSFILSFAIAEHFKEDLKPIDLKVCGKGMLISLILSVLFILTPTTKEAAAIYLVPKVANSQEFKQTCGELYNIAVEWLHELKQHKKDK